MTLTEASPIVVAFLASGALVTGFFQRRLVKRQADNAVVTGATGVVELYKMYAARQDADIIRLNDRIKALELAGAECERRCDRMMVLLLRHGINFEET